MFQNFPTVPLVYLLRNRIGGSYKFKNSEIIWFSQFSNYPDLQLGIFQFQNFFHFGIWHNFRYFLIIEKFRDYRELFWYQVRQTSSSVREILSPKKLDHEAALQNSFKIVIVLHTWAHMFVHEWRRDTYVYSICGPTYVRRPS